VCSELLYVYYITTTGIKGTGKLDEEEKSEIKIWDLRVGKCLNTIKAHRYDVRCIAVTPDGRYILSCGEVEDNIKIWNLLL
jgi:WD40 repeat protein